MINIETFFRNHLDTPKILDFNMRKFAEINLQRMMVNNTGGIYNDLITNTTTAYNDYYGAISDEDTKTAIKEGSTVAMNDAMGAFKNAASQKEGIVRGTYGKDSPTYQEFYPHGITEYSSASLENVGVLMDRMVNAATTHQAEVGVPFLTLFTDLRTTFNTARTAQLALMGEVEGMRDVSIEKRDVIEVQLMKNILFIAFNNVGNVEAMNTYFDQSFIRPKEQKTFSGDVPAGETVNIDERTFGELDEIILENTGTVALTFCLAPSAGDACASGISVNAEDKVTVTAADLGDYEANHFLNVTNNEGSDGSYKVVVEL
ncbi:MAG: hypothetical protein ISS16_07755 [Ignavibacteria bacterium]|nr:hypothetical protein [Ignavibacteria bacterium]